MGFQVHLRGDLMVSAQFQHLLATHQDPAEFGRFVLEDFHLAGAALFHLVVRRVESVELGAFAEENVLVFFARFHFDGGERDDRLERAVQLVGIVFATAFTIVVDIRFDFGGSGETGECRRATGQTEQGRWLTSAEDK